MRDYRTRAAEIENGAVHFDWDTPSAYWKGGGKPKYYEMDFESYGEVDLGKCGSYRYIEDKSFEPLMLACAFDDEDVFILDLACGDEVPDIIWAAIFDDDITKIAWNAQFERTIFSKMAGHTLSPDSWKCAMVWAASLSLPLALRNAAIALKTGEQKDRAGEDLIRYFSIPCKPTKANGGRVRNLPEHAPDKWEKFKSYCLQDVRTERDIRKVLERLPLVPHEWDYYHMDQRINDRGVLIDTELVTQAIACDLALSDEMTNRAYALTGLENPNSVSQLRTWLGDRGIEVPSLGKKEVAAMISELEKNVNASDTDALEMLKLRLRMAKSSVKKYQAAERCTCSDGRARGLFQFSGANRTQRWSGRNIQLQNLVRNEISTLDEARDLVKMGCFDMVESIYGNTPDVLSQLCRTMLIPKPGCEFIVADFSAIEARVLAFLAGEQWRLNSFKAGEDIYCASASAMFGVPVVKHGVNGELRAKGKVAELACVAADQLVATDQGMVPIQNVTKDMLVWDGEEWVNHHGVVYQGERECISYGGLTATPDHIIISNNMLRSFSFIAGDEAVDAGVLPVYDIRDAGPRHQYVVNNWLVHNCGYGGGAGALIAMNALEMGLTEEDLPKLISDWRDANPNITKFWYDVERAAIDTVDDHQEHQVRDILFRFHMNTLWMYLPSGRPLAYISPRLQPNRFGRMAITFMGLGANNKWGRGETYSGKLVENCLSGGTLVLTDHGLVPVENVRTSDLIWDGIEWVHHEGVVHKGIQNTIEVISDVARSGLHMTPEHKILTEDGWIECGRSEGLNWAEVWCPDSFETCRKKDGDRRDNATLSSGTQLANRITVRPTGFQERVYDIRNCGPRHRFAVWDPGAECLRIVSNCTQATARDLLAEAMWRMEQAGLEIVGHVHDEVIIEAPEGKYSVDDVCEIMNQNPPWAEGLPLASAGYKGKYYFKD